MRCHCQTSDWVQIEDGVVLIWIRLGQPVERLSHLVVSTIKVGR